MIHDISGSQTKPQRATSRKRKGIEPIRHCPPSCNRFDVSTSNFLQGIRTTEPSKYWYFMFLKFKICKGKLIRCNQIYQYKQSKFSILGKFSLQKAAIITFNRIAIYSCSTKIKFGHIGPASRSFNRAGI